MVRGYLGVDLLEPVCVFIEFFFEFFKLLLLPEEILRGGAAVVFEPFLSGHILSGGALVLE